MDFPNLSNVIAQLKVIPIQDPELLHKDKFYNVINEHMLKTRAEGKPIRSFTIINNHYRDDRVYTMIELNITNKEEDILAIANVIGRIAGTMYSVYLYCPYHALVLAHVYTTCRAYVDADKLFRYYCDFVRSHHSSDKPEDTYAINRYFQFDYDARLRSWGILNFYRGILLIGHNLSNHSVIWGEWDDYPANDMHANLLTWLPLEMVEDTLNLGEINVHYWRKRIANR